MTPMTPLRFTGNVPLQNWRQELKTLDTQLGDVVLQESSASMPLTRVQQGKGKALAGLKALGILLVSGVVGWGGYVGLSSYRAQMPSKDMKAFHQALGEDWGHLRGNIQAAQKTGGASNPLLAQKFNQDVEGLMTRLVLTLKANPGGLDQELVRQLKWTSTFMSDDVVNNLSGQYFRFMEGRLAAQGVKLDNADVIHIQAVSENDIVSGVLNKTDALSHLSSIQKQDLARELRREFIQIERDGGYAAPTSFSDLMKGALDSGIKGVTLGQFIEVKDEAGAIELFKSVVNNSENFKELTAVQKEALIGRGTEALSALELDGANPLLGLAALAGLLISAMGIGFGTIRKGSEMIEGLDSLRDFYHGLTSPTLVIQLDPLANPESARLIGDMSLAINEKAEEAATVIRQGFSSDQSVKTLLLKAYGSEEKLPTAAQIKQRFLLEAKETILKGQSTRQKLSGVVISELNLLDQVLKLVETIELSGQYTVLGLPKELATPKPASPDKATSPLHKLQLQKAFVMYELTQAQKYLANRGLSLTAVTMKYNTQQERVVRLEKELEGVAEKNQANATSLMAELKEAHGQLERLGESQRQQQLLVGKAQEVLEEKITGLTSAQTELETAMTGGAFADNVQELTRMREDMQALIQKVIAEKEAQQKILKQPVSAAAAG